MHTYMRTLMLLLIVTRLAALLLTLLFLRILTLPALFALDSKRAEHTTYTCPRATILFSTLLLFSSMFLTIIVFVL